MDSSPESRDGVETRQIPSMSTRMTFKQGLMTTLIKRLFKSCYNGVSRSPKEAWKDAYELGPSGDSLEPEQSCRHSIVSISSLKSLPSLGDLLAPRTPPEMAELPPATRQTRPEPA